MLSQIKTRRDDNLSTLFDFAHLLIVFLSIFEIKFQNALFFDQPVYMKWQKSGSARA